MPFPPVTFFSSSLAGSEGRGGKGVGRGVQRVRGCSILPLPNHPSTLSDGVRGVVVVESSRSLSSLFSDSTRWRSLHSFSPGGEF